MDSSLRQKEYMKQQKLLRLAHADSCPTHVGLVLTVLICDGARILCVTQFLSFFENSIV